MSHKLRIFTVIFLILAFLPLATCTGTSTPQHGQGEVLLLPMASETNGAIANGQTKKSSANQTAAAAGILDSKAQATLDAAYANLNAAQTQDQNTANLVAATARIARANAQGTLSSANATLGAAQTQDQSNANAIAAKLAATAEIVRAKAQATLDSANATQRAAQTQDAIQQTEMASMATSDAMSLLIQQNKSDNAEGTQTAAANYIATQTQEALATSEWYVDQERQRSEQRQGPINFMLMWCLPLFLILFGGVALWGFWRLLKIQQENQEIYNSSINRFPAPTADTVDHRPVNTIQYIDSNTVDHRNHLTNPEDQVGRWLNEVKDELKTDNDQDENDVSNT